MQAALMTHEETMFHSRIARMLLWLCAAAAFIPGVSLAQPYPSRPIRLLLGYSPGGGMDNLARLFAPKLHELLGVPVVIENKPGASELLAAQPVMNSPPDGYTLWLGSGGALVQGPGVRTDLPYQPLKSFTPIALIAEGEAVLLMRNDVPVNTVGELVTYAKAHPGKLNYGSAGVGSGSHLTVEYLMALTGGSLTHIPYKGDTESTRDAMAGNVDFVMAMAQTAAPLISEKKLKPIAVTGSQRLKIFPDLPTVAESGVPELKNVGSYTFYALMGPAGMHPEVVQRLNEAFNKVAAMPDIAQRLREVGLRPANGSAAAFSQYLEKELAKWQLMRGKVKVGTS
jgi:tripartite-type tricarboxylate transporter receptor subunit TctC